jgi:hypothetical protein
MNIIKRINLKMGFKIVAAALFTGLSVVVLKPKPLVIVMVDGKRFINIVSDMVFPMGFNQASEEEKNKALEYTKSVVDEYANAHNYIILLEHSIFGGPVLDVTDSLIKESTERLEKFGVQAAVEYAKKQAEVVKRVSESVNKIKR